MGKYSYLTLTSRAGVALPTTNKVLDVKGYAESGLSASLSAEMQRHLKAGNPSDAVPPSPRFLPSIDVSRLWLDGRM